MSQMLYRPLELLDGLLVLAFVEVLYAELVLMILLETEYSSPEGHWMLLGQSSCLRRNVGMSRLGEALFTTLAVSAPTPA